MKKHYRVSKYLGIYEAKDEEEAADLMFSDYYDRGECEGPDGIVVQEVISDDRANEIVVEEQIAGGWDPRDANAPMVSNGELCDGGYWETARLESEDALRQQIRKWIESFRDDLPQVDVEYGTGLSE